MKNTRIKNKIRLLYNFIPKFPEDKTNLNEITLASYSKLIHNILEKKYLFSFNI